MQKPHLVPDRALILTFYLTKKMEARVDKQKLCLLFTIVMAATSTVVAAPASMHAFVQKRFGVQAYGESWANARNFFNLMDQYVVRYGYNSWSM